MLKMIHTSDLHLGRKWKIKQLRWGDNQRVLREILDYAEAEQVDLLVFAGDLIEDGCEPEAEMILDEFIRQVLPALQRGAGVVIVPGNHDRPDLFRLVATMLRQIAGPQARPLLVCPRPGVYDAPGHPELQIVALPYMKAKTLREPEPLDAPFLEGAALNQALSVRLATGLQYLGTRVDPQRPAIFVGHIQINGVTIESRELGYDADVCLNPADLPHYTQYNALGHIHACQPVEGASVPSWYCGSPDRQDLGERNYVPGFLRVDLTLQPGEKCEPVRVEVRGATPFIQAQLEDEQRLRAFVESPPPPETLGKVTLVCQALEFNAWRSDVLAVCPRVVVERAPAPAAAGTTAPVYAVQDHRQVILSVLRDRYTGQDLTDREALLQGLFEEVGHVN